MSYFQWPLGPLSHATEPLFSEQKLTRSNRWKIWSIILKWTCYLSETFYSLSVELQMFKIKTWKEHFLTPKGAEVFARAGQGPLCTCSTLEGTLAVAIHFGKKGLGRSVKLWRWMRRVFLCKSPSTNSKAQFPHQTQHQIGAEEAHLCWSWCARSRSGTVGRGCSWVGCWRWCGDTAHRKSGRTADRREGRCRCRGTRHRSGIPCPPLPPPHFPATTTTAAWGPKRNTWACATSHAYFPVYFSSVLVYLFV